LKTDRVFGIALLVSTAAGLYAQAPEALLSTKDVNQLCQRSQQLMEAGGVVIPDLQRASAPLIESVRQACIQLQATAGAGQPTYLFMTNLRAYLALADAIPKPFPFPDAASKQFTELREESTRLESHFRALIDSKETQLRNPDRDNLQRYSDANNKVPPPSASKPRVVFLGDSITDFWRLNEYYTDSDFLNRGISGQITSQMLGRLKADVIDLHPAAVVILAGTNDLNRQIPLTTIENNYLMMVDLATLYKVKVIFASLTPVSDYHKDVNPSFEMTKGRPPVFINALNDWIQKLCAGRGYVYLDYYKAMVDASGQLQSDLSDDGLHPNAKGYRVMAPLALQAIEKSIGNPAAPPPPSKPAKRRPSSN
jgi:lysophospholipase L1-like esterase